MQGAVLTQLEAMLAGEGDRLAGPWWHVVSSDVRDVAVAHPRGLVSPETLTRSAGKKGTEAVSPT